MESIKVKNNIGYFPELDSLGIKNGFTYSNTEWESMAITSSESLNKYTRFFNELNLDTASFLYISAEQNDDFKLIDEMNFPIHKAFNKSDYESESLSFTRLRCDSIITKLSIPIIITPADCAVIVVTGIDKKDGKRFVIVNHTGIFGAMLDNYLKSLEYVKSIYDFEMSDLSVFIFPVVSQEYYTIKNDDDLRKGLRTSTEWSGYIVQYDNNFAVDIESRVINELEKEGISNIKSSGVDTYSAHKQGKLYSRTYSKHNNLDFGNFAVCVSL